MAGHTIGARSVKGAVGTAFGGVALDSTFRPYGFLTLPTGFNPEVAGFPKGGNAAPFGGERSTERGAKPHSLSPLQGQVSIL